MRGIILGLNLYDFTSELKVGDIVTIDGTDDFYTLLKIDPRYGKNKGEEDNPYKYFVKSKFCDELMNFERSEISKANIAFFDYYEWFNNGKKKLLGIVSALDHNHIKGKVALNYDYGFSQFNLISIDDFIGLDFYGSIKEKELYLSTSPDSNVINVIKYFNISIPTQSN